MTEDDIISEILKSEGWPKYTNDPDDRGGPTKGGITQATLALYRGRLATPEDVQNMNEEEARAIYQNRYIKAPNFDQIKNDELRAHVIDAGVLHGVGTASEWLQAIAGVKANGKLGPISQTAINAMSPREVSTKFAALRIRYIGTILNNNYKARQNKLTAADQSRFAAGWLNRATAFLDALGTA